MNLDLYKQNIRMEYYNLSSDLEETSLRRYFRQLIDFKNIIPRRDLYTFDIMTNEFAPENDNYLPGLISSLFIPILLWITFLLIVVFLVFFIGRFICKKCDAVQEKDEAFNMQKKRQYVCAMWIIGLLLLGSVAVTVFGNFGFFKVIN